MSTQDISGFVQSIKAASYSINAQKNEEIVSDRASFSCFIPIKLNSLIIFFVIVIYFYLYSDSKLS